MKPSNLSTSSKLKTVFVGVLFSATLLQSCSIHEEASAKSPSQAKVEKADAGWRSLIADGNLDAWKKIGGNAGYVLEDDTIIGTSIASRDSTYFTTGEIFSDFIFEVDVQAEAPLNSGVQFRSKKIQGNRGATVAGYQMEIDTAPRAWSGGIFDQGRRGWLYTLSRNESCSKEFKVDGWNKYRVEAVGQSIRTYINNVPCSNLIDDLSPTGFIALQIHSAGGDKVNKTVKWRDPKILTNNIKDHVNKPADIEQFSYINNQITTEQQANGWQLLWDGQSNTSPQQTGDWKIKNQALKADAKQQKNSLTIPVTSHYFELEFDVNSSDNADNGIHYLRDTNGKGFEFQLSSETTVEQTANNNQAMGAIVGRVAPTNLTEPKGWGSLRIGKGWNRVRLVVKGSQIEHWINNIKMVDYQYIGVIPKTVNPVIVENSKGSIEVKNLKLRNLPKPEGISKKSNPGDREGHVMKKVVPENIIPEAPILSIEQAMNSFVVHPDFAVEVIADSPLIFDPVFAIYDSAGRVWALEMTTYMQDTLATGEMKHDSQIVMLTDTDQDGTMDTRQVVLPNLILPRALAFIDKGIIWADNTSLYFSELSETDGKVSLVKTEMVDKDYAKGGNVEHKPNGLLFSLDNWYYSAKSSKRYRPYPLAVDLPKDTKEIYRNKYWKMAVGPTEFRGQWGITQDDYGRHYFLDNSSPLRTTSYLPNVVYRNKKQAFPKELINQNVGRNDIYPIRVTPGINRGYMEGMYDKDFKLKGNTAAGGPVFYRGNQYPEQYRHISLVTEPAANLMRANKVIDTNGQVTGKNLFEKQEILASTDERFRPVNTNNTPDGTVMIVDFYHGILQHRTYLTTYLSDQIKSRDLERSKHIGRLYRLKSKTNPMPKVDYLNDLSAAELVPFLAHDNGWHRDMAQQLLVMKQDSSVIQALQKMVTTSDNHLAQIKALWVLEGLGQNKFDILKQAATTNNAKVKSSIYRLVELLPSSSAIKTWLAQQSQSVSQEAAQALVLAAGTHQAWPATANIINKYGNSAFVEASLANHEADFLASQQNNIQPEAAAEIAKLSNTVLKTKKKLTGSLAKSAAKGKLLFNGEAGCFGCHGADGEGNPAIPPLNKSEWVTGDPKRLAGILLHGFSGPITVKGKTYDSGMVMPGMAQAPNISDEDIADIATYIRNAWNNRASEVSSSTIQSVRYHTEDQDMPYTNETIKKMRVH
ncbi:PVC-type heme-binding CxxCH protein [Paraglaciecola sp. L3A3]|uniref:PVC-type heme-binding CxxCH protein n=1 Tax=Paraglaciecola sp. L3A3 TaxID=2686358 RepID=UPI00131BA8EC|nr:PVC-type heme-binding CxxCH protein [Paraglaciecola sp. L3A3]